MHETHGKSGELSKCLLRSTEYVFESIQYGSEPCGTDNIERLMKDKRSILYNPVSKVGTSEVDSKCSQLRPDLLLTL